MDISASAMVNTALNMQSSSTSEAVGTLMLRKSLNTATDEINQLMQSVAPQVATSGTLGTQVNTYA
ncbi:putative motility protein [Bordetella sp. FB-8]|uniref:putative motility protein n=1 Tax=Bordetella sp. FB-8 TaxID=1159870 RepID=UPI0003647CAD|nr:putative motility protein [Bordetella sp. FB-8]